MAEVSSYAIVIDDEKDSRDDVVKAFPSGRFRKCRVFKSRRQFEDQFLNKIKGETFSNLPSLIFIDIRMEEEDSGFKVLKAIRGDPKLRRVPAVIISGSDEHSDIEQAYALGATLYLLKPDEPKTFVKDVGRLVRTVSRCRIQCDIAEYLQELER